MSEAHRDPFTDHVIGNMPPEVRATFTPGQLDAIQAALARAQESARARHLVDVRFCIPLYWQRLYVVILLGKDQRRQVRAVLVDRRARVLQGLKLCVVLLVLAFIGLGLAVSVFLLLYLAKCVLGIDIFPDRHLVDILGLTPR